MTALFVMIEAGGGEYGALIERREDGAPCRIMLDEKLPPPPDLQRYVKLINRLLAEGLPFAALGSLAQDSPRVGPLIEQIEARLAALEGVAGSA